jgi:hypothetical protein
MKKREPKEIIISYVDRVLGPSYSCPICLHEVKNNNQTCKYCNQELLEKKDVPVEIKTEGFILLKGVQK